MEPEPQTPQQTPARAAPPPAGYVVTDVTVTVERSVQPRPYESCKVFIAAKAQVLPGFGDADTTIGTLLAMLNAKADVEEARIRLEAGK